MPRNTLEWEKCDHCGRRMATSDCMIGGRTFRLCPYCAIAMVSLGLAECRNAIVRLPRPASALGRGMSRVDSLIESIGDVKGVKTRGRTRSARRKAGSRRRS